jgi:hypothetical protein
MGSHCSFGHLKHKLWPKEGPRVKLAVWLPTTKSRGSTSSEIRFESATRRWKAFDERYNFALDLVAIRLWSREIWASKVPGLQTGIVSGLQLGSPGKNSYLDVVSAVSCKVYHKGEGGGFSQVWAVVSLVCLCLVLAPKVLQLCTNHFVWFVCRPVWVNEACQLFLVPSQSSNTPPLPLKVVWAKEHALTPSSDVSYLGSHLGPLKSWECVTPPLMAFLK